MTRPGCNAILAYMKELFYFAYGSNMSTRRLRGRVPGARPVDVARLAGHRLAWHKKGRDGSGKCDIPACGGDAVVYGVLYSIDAGQKHRLDSAEGRGYEQKTVEVWLLNREEGVNALTYCATRIDSRYIPYDWYRDHVLIGAREHGLPDYYVRMIENVPTFEDLDKQREKAERRLHESD